MQAIVISIIGLVFLLLVLAIGGVINSKEPYACPNCGYLFVKKWYSLMFKSGPIVKDGSGELRLKCPTCKKTDFCLHTKRNKN